MRTFFVNQWVVIVACTVCLVSGVAIGHDWVDLSLLHELERVTQDAEWCANRQQQELDPGAPLLRAKSMDRMQFAKRQEEIRQ